MKKIRLLALLLAILMIPFAMFIACNDDEDPDEDPDDDENGDDDTTEVAPPVSVGNKVVDDGGAKGTSLLYFTFDNADRGNLGVITAPTSSTDSNYAEFSDLKPIEPYYTYFNGRLVKGGAYIVKEGSNSNNKYLSIQRTGGVVSSPALDFNISNFVASYDLEQTHIIEFKLDFTKGLIDSDSEVAFKGVKGSITQDFFTIADNVMYDCNGTAIYGEKDTDKRDWVTVDVVVDDGQKKYDIYIDLVRQTNSLSYSNTSYPSWNQTPALTGYRFEILAKGHHDVYLRLDDINIKNGAGNVLGTDLEEDFIVEHYDEVEFKYSFLEPTAKGVYRFIDNLTDVKTELTGDGTLLASRLTLSKINTATGAISDVYTDYAALGQAGADAELASDEVYGVKLINFAKLGNLSMPFDPIWYKSNSDKLSDFKFGFYATQAMVDAGVTFKLRFTQPGTDAPVSTFNVAPAVGTAVAGISKGNIVYTAGYNSFDVTLALINESKSADGFSFTEIASIDLIWDESAKNNTTDALYITDFGYLMKVNVKVEEPDDEYKDCEHTDPNNDSVDLFAPVNTGMVEGNCNYGSHYLKYCTQCNATKVDQSKTLGYLKPHTYSAVKTQPSTCYEDGYTYRECDCGHKEIIDTVETTGHTYVVVTINGKDVTQVCRYCGAPDSFTIRNELMNFQQKMNELGYSETEKNNWSTSQDINANIDLMGPASGDYSSAITKHLSMKAAGGSQTSAKTVDTDYGTMLKITGGSKNTEWYINFSGLNYQGKNFVIEYDFMLGKKGTNGEYPPIRMVGVSWNGGSITGSFGQAILQKDGSLRLSGYHPEGNKLNVFTGAPAYKLVENKVYNIAHYYDVQNNKVKLYINGIYIDEAQFLGSVEDSMRFKANQHRISAYNYLAGAEVYFDNFLHYAANEEPICVLTEGFVGGTDFEGEVELEDDLLNVMKPDFNVATNGKDDVKVGVPAALYLKEYVIELAIDAKDELTNGTILKITKNGLGIDRTVDVVTVNGGKLYVMGVLVSETTDVKLSLAFNDNINTLAVYVDGVRVSGTIRLEGDFADADATIRSFTLLRECGDYAVSGLKMYTGTEVK